MTIRPFLPLGLAAVIALPLAASADPLSIFQPTQVRAVSVTPSDVKAMRALPPLDAFGALRGTRVPGVDEVGSAQEAAQDAGYALRLPANVPAAFGSNVHYQVTQRARTTFTFDGAKAAAWARTNKVTLHPLPPGLDGTTFTATLAPIAIVTYGVPPRNERHERGVRRTQFLAVMQAPLPSVTSSGASLQTLATWFAAQPGVPKDLVAQIQALGDPTQTLPIPVRFDKQTATPVDVDGVHGLAIGDQTGIGSAIVWMKDGKLFALGGTLTQTDAVALANALK